ncbi:MAG TPA: zf-HC2 domain-containing protein [Myxococcota bacterium]
MNACDRMGPLLDAYHDGELGRLRSWTVRRHLGRCPACRQELATLGEVGAWVRDALEEPLAPDLWSELRGRLPAREARSAPAPGERLRWSLPARSAFGLPAFGAAAVAAGLALAVWVGVPDRFVPGLQTTATSVVRSLNTHGRPVVVLEGAGAGEATIIWLMDEEGVQGTEEIASVWI